METQTSPFHLVLGLGQKLWKVPWSLWAVCAPAWSISQFQQEGHSSQNASRGIAVLEAWDKGMIHKGRKKRQLTVWRHLLCLSCLWLTCRGAGAAQG